MKFVLYALSIIFLFAGCSGKTMVTLLPEDGGKVGKIDFVDDSGKRVLIDKAWESLEIHNGKDAKSTMLGEKEVRSRYDDTISAMPPKPISYLVFFDAESFDISHARKELDSAVAAIKSKKPTLVVCAGHTDTMGEKSYNKTLSLKRAEVVAKYLISKGIDKDLIELHYYGDANLLVKTANGVPHSKNRRVEILLK
ncbi:MAG: OmpA family protein [Campylobacterales bacterium]|nr:OmpA family protein [Campylobacterales bacterium]